LLRDILEFSKDAFSLAWASGGARGKAMGIVAAVRGATAGHPALRQQAPSAEAGSIAADHQQWSSSGVLHAAPCRECEITWRRHYAATGSIRLESLFLTLPTRVLTGQHVIFSDE